MSYHLDLLKNLLKFKSETPNDDGCIQYIANLLADFGFECSIIEFQEDGYDKVSNLYARLGRNGFNFCFAGHVDVVPAGNLESWSHDPFYGSVVEEQVYGRGAVDMKGAIAAFIDAFQRVKTSNKLQTEHSISLLLTADEEGIAINGIKKMAPWLEAKGEKIDFCIIGEPTSMSAVGDTIKIGARGSVTVVIEVFGIQGHVAYHELADNPITTLNKIMLALKSEVLDEGNLHFQPSNLEFTNLLVGNEAENVIPGVASARLNIRFGDMHTAVGLVSLVERVCQIYTQNFKIKWHSSGEAFVTKHSTLVPIASEAIMEVMGFMPNVNTLGGTSDARFLTKYCQIIELGLLNSTAHKVDERVSLRDLENLTKIYAKILEKCMALTLL